jgi:uncharacterized protein (TIGR03083 family)
MSELASAYESAWKRVGGFVEGLTDDQLTTAVPATPGWRVRDVVAHMVGVAGDMTEGRFPMAGVDAWTAEQVAQRKDLPFEAVVEEWAQRVPPFLDAMNGPLAVAAGNFVADIVSHELDMRNALGMRDGRDTPELPLAFDLFVTMLSGGIDGNKLPALVLKADDREVVAGAGDPGATVTASAFELLRSISGRRTHDEIRALAWTGDPEPYLAVIAPYAPPATSLKETT